MFHNNLPLVSRIDIPETFKHKFNLCGVTRWSSVVSVLRSRGRSTMHRLNFIGFRKTLEIFVTSPCRHKKPQNFHPLSEQRTHKAFHVKSHYTNSQYVAAQGDQLFLLSAYVFKIREVTCSKTLTTHICLCLSASARNIANVSSHRKLKLNLEKSARFFVHQHTRVHDILCTSKSMTIQLTVICKAK